MRSLFYDIHRTVANTVERAGYSVSRILSMLAISKLMGGILEESEKVPGITKGATRKHATSGGRFTTND